MRLHPTSTLITLIIITLTIQCTLSTIQVKGAEELEITIKRTIDIKANYASTTDEITIIKGKLENLTYYIPKRYEENLYNIKAIDENGEEIQFNIIKKNRTYIEFKLKQTKTPYKFKVKIYWINIYQSFIVFIRVKLPLYPTIPVKVSEFQAIAMLPPEAENVTRIAPNATTQLNERWIIKFNKTTLPPMISTDTVIDFKGEIQHTIARSITREIYPNGKIQVKETIIFENLGYTDITTKRGINFTLPPQAKVTSVEDDFGQLSYKTYNTNNTVIINIKPRINIKENWKYRVFIKYELPSNQWITGNGEKQFKIPINSYHNLPIDQFKIIVYIPSGSKVLSISGETPIQSNQNKIVYQGEKIVEEVNLQETTITYTPPPATFTIPTNIIIGVVTGIIIGTAIFIKRYIVKPAKPIKKIESEIAMKTEELSDAIREKIEILLSLREIEETLRRKKITRKAHKIRVKELRSELRKIEIRVTSLKNELKTKNAKTRVIVEEIDKIEKELTSLIMKAIQNERQYMLKRISRATFQENKSKLEKEIRKTRLKLESKIAELTEIVV